MATQNQRRSDHKNIHHGLTSRAVATARAASVRELALALAAKTPHAHDVCEVAEEVAAIIFGLRDISRLRLEYLSREMLQLDSPSGADGGTDAAERGPLVDELCRVLDAMQRESTALNRLAEYERKMRSRYRKLVKRLDYLTIETLRRKA